MGNMVRQSVYVETTISSYLVAKPSADPLTANRQEITKRWWKTRSQYVLLISPEVIREIKSGAAVYAAKRAEVLSDIPILEFLPAIAQITDVLFSSGIFPVKARSDAIHLAFASAHASNILVTWNLKHLANPVSMRRSRDVISMLGFEMPEIFTPEQLLASGD
jgi:hypothetical protein